jgi:hypothetical protein
MNRLPPRGKFSSDTCMTHPAEDFLSSFMPTRAGGAVPTKSKARLLKPRDLAKLRALELERWGADGATADMLGSRIRHAPAHSWGYHRDGGISASCFVMGSTRERILLAASWHEVTDQGYATSHDARSRTWFGVSLSGTDPVAVRAVLIEVLLKMLLDGVKEVYLGSPVPSFARWKGKNPGGTMEAYFRKRRGRSGRHSDPQLAYYESLGFKIVGWKPDYFPHAGSQDHGVLVRLANPLWLLSGAIRWVPSRLLRSLLGRIFGKEAP